MEKYKLFFENEEVSDKVSYILTFLDEIESVSKIELTLTVKKKIFKELIKEQMRNEIEESMGSNFENTIKNFSVNIVKNFDHMKLSDKKRITQTDFLKYYKNMMGVR